MKNKLISQNVEHIFRPVHFSKFYAEFDTKTVYGSKWIYVSKQIYGVNELYGANII